MGIVERIQAEGTSHGGPYRRLPAFVDYLRLRRMTIAGKCLVVVFGNELVGVSASPILDYKGFKLIRDSPISQQITYYSVEPALGGR